MLVQGVKRLLSRDDYARADGRCERPPEWLVLVINNFCNLKCKMCDVGLGDSSTVFWANLIGDDPHNMTLDMLNAILSQASAFQPRPKIGLAYTEPLIHVKVLDFCRAIVEQGFFCQITTNGTTLPRLADAFVEIGVDDITISVDGPAEVHDRVRGKPGTFEKLYQGVERLNAAKARLKRTKPLVRFSFTITDENTGHILDFIQQVEPLRPASINISHLNFITDEMAALHNAHYNGDLAVTKSNLGTMDPAAFDTDAIWDELERVRAYARSRRPGFPSLHITPEFADRRKLDVFYREPLTFVGGRNCTDPWKLAMIKTDGTVIPAHGRCFNYPVGNINDAPLPAIWNSPRFIAFRQLLKGAGGTLPACARCCGVIGKAAKSVASTFV